MSNDLEDLLHDLMAAPAGAAQVAAGVIVQGKVQAATGLKSLDVPGPSLQAALAEHTGAASGSASGSAAAAPGIATHLADAGANRLMKLLAGR